MHKNLKLKLNYDIERIAGNETLYFGDFCNSDSRYERIISVEKVIH